MPNKRWMDKDTVVYAMGFYSFVEKNEVLAFAGK